MKEASIFFILSITWKVHSLECYSNYLKDHLYIISPSPKVVNCDEPPENDLSCYTLAFRVDTFNKSSVNVDIRTCFLKNGCENLTETITVQTPRRIITEIVCKECFEDLCNLGITSDIVESKSSGASFKQNLYIGASTCGVVGVIGTLLHCLCCRKFKNKRTCI